MCDLQCAFPLSCLMQPLSRVYIRSGNPKKAVGHFAQAATGLMPRVAMEGKVQNAAATNLCAGPQRKYSMRTDDPRSCCNAVLSSG